MRRILRILAVGYAGLALGCGDPGKSENTGAPIELNKTKNAPAGYGAPDGGAPTGPPTKPPTGSPKK